VYIALYGKPIAELSSITQGRGNRGVRGSNDPPEIYLGSNMVFCPPQIFFGKKYFLVHTHTESTSYLHYILKLGLGVCFCNHL